MKILLVAPEYPPFIIGGGGIIYENLVKNYTKLGHQVVVVYGYYPTQRLNEKIKMFHQQGIKYYQLPEIPTPSFFPDFKIRMPLNIDSLSTIKKIIDQENPDVAHLHGYGFSMIDTWASKLKKNNIPYLFTIHGWPIKHQTTNPITKVLVQFYLDIFSTQTLANANKISTVSNFLKTQIPTKFQHKTSVIYNPFEITKNLPQLNKNIDFKKEITILSLGRISWIKGFQEIIKIVPSLTSQNINIKYLIAGSDEGYKQELLTLIQTLGLKNRVKFLGQLDEKQKWAHLKKADFVAIPSLIEGFGLVSLEAITLGKPIIYGKSGAVQEIIKNYSKKVSIFDKNLIKKMKQIYSLKSIFDFSPFRSQKIAKDYLKLLDKIQK